MLQQSSTGTGPTQRLNYTGCDAQDVDGPFGSAGSFFRFRALHGSYEVNPPFVPAVMDAAAAHLLALLAAAEASNQVRWKN